MSEETKSTQATMEELNKKLDESIELNKLNLECSMIELSVVSTMTHLLQNHSKDLKIEELECELLGAMSCTCDILSARVARQIVQNEMAKHIEDSIDVKALFGAIFGI